MCHEAYDDGYQAYTECRRLMAKQQRRFDRGLTLVICLGLTTLLWAAIAARVGWLWN
jgi:hypothetical protein